MSPGFDAWFVSTPLERPLRYEIVPGAVVLRLPTGTRLAEAKTAPLLDGVFPSFTTALDIPDLGLHVLHKLAPPGTGIEPEVLVQRLSQAGQAPAWPVRDHPQGELKVVVGEVVIAFSAPTSRARAEQLVQGAGWTVRRTLEPYAPLAFVLSPTAVLTAAGLEAALRQFRRLSGVIASYPVAPGAPGPTRSHAPPDLWHLGGAAPNLQRPAAGQAPVARLGANVRAAWPSAGGGVGVTVAILEGEAIDVTHPQLGGTINDRPKLAEAIDLTLEGKPAPMPDAHSKLGLHGTACAGVALARGLVETDPGDQQTYQAVGTAPNARLLAIRCAAGVGSLAEADAIAYAAERADVISCSWGPDVRPPAISRMPDHTRWALEYAFAKGRGGLGCVVCFSTGHDSNRVETTDLNEYASCPGVIAVGACDHLGEGTRYSVRGPAVAVVFPSSSDMADTTYRRIATIQPGARPQLRYLPWHGMTSAACAATAGVAALLLAAHAKLSSREVAAILRATCQPAKAMHKDAALEHQVGAGRIDSGAAVARASRPHAARAALPWPVDAEPLLDAPTP
jgi:subtilisin family serine protease